jgi:hypothetical protein
VVAVDSPGRPAATQIAKTSLRIKTGRSKDRIASLNLLTAVGGFFSGFHIADYLFSDPRSRFLDVPVVDSTQKLSLFFVIELELVAVERHG